VTFVHRALGRYSDDLLRRVADVLVRPRNKLPAEELIEKCAAALENAALVDRRVRDMPGGPRAVLTAVARSRQTTWKVGHLVTLAAALGHADGFKPVEELLASGLLYPAEGTQAVADFESWFAGAGGLSASCVVPPSVIVRAASMPVELAALPSDTAPGTPNAVDGLDWPLRLAAVRQRVESEPVRITRTGTLYKKDQSRFEGDPVLTVAGVKDSGVLSLFWAAAAGVLGRDGDTLTANEFPPAWDGPLGGLTPDLLAGYFAVETWDPLGGAVATDAMTPAGPTAALLVLLHLAHVPGGAVVESSRLADWLWEHHPGFSSIIPTEHQKTHGTAWVEALVAGVFDPLGVTERVGAGARLTARGRHLLTAETAPAEPAAFPHTLLVQPNAEILAYRQGLTPSLIATLSKFADWTVVGPACTLLLTETRVYRGLENGLTVAEILHPLQKFGSRPVPAAVEDLVRRWGSKRERVSVYASATLVEFPTPADLDVAIQRGVCAIRLTDRIGLTADGRDPDYASLRLIGNRDYEARPQPCVRVGDDGVTWTIDAALADLLLDSELARIADSVADDVPGTRRVRASAEKLRTAAERGMTREELDHWFVMRSGHPAPPAALLFSFGPRTANATSSRDVIVRFASAELTDGIWQWPVTRELLSERIGPAAVVVPVDNQDALISRLSEIGVTVDMK
jgi:hypothetical protein